MTTTIPPEVEQSAQAAREFREGVGDLDPRCDYYSPDGQLSGALLGLYVMPRHFFLGPAAVGARMLGSNNVVFVMDAYEAPAEEGKETQRGHLSRRWAEGDREGIREVLTFVHARELQPFRIFRQPYEVRDGSVVFDDLAETPSARIFTVTEDEFWGTTFPLDDAIGKEDAVRSMPGVRDLPEPEQTRLLMALFLNALLQQVARSDEANFAVMLPHFGLSEQEFIEATQAVCSHEYLSAVAHFWWRAVKSS